MEFYGVSRVLSEETRDESVLWVKVKWAGSKADGNKFEDSWIPATFLQGTNAYSHHVRVAEPPIR